MLFIYNVLLIFAVIISLPYWIIRIIITPKYHANLLQRITFYPKNIVQGLAPKKPVWIHAVSVGETLTAILLVKSIKNKYPDIPILLSTVTLTGKRIAEQNNKYFDGIIYFPLDLPILTRRAIRLFSPRLILIMETELWPNFIYQAYRNKIPICLINGRISDKSFQNYARYKYFVGHTVNRLSAILVQSELDAHRMERIDADKNKIHITGNIKFDITPPELNEADKNKLIQEFHISLDQNKVIIAGSTHPGEEHILINIFQKLKNKYNKLKLILAPRHPERTDEIRKLISQFGFKFAQRSQMNNPHPEADIYLIDTVGELFNLYLLSDIVFIGGSLIPKGGHNILEPAVCSKPVLFGPNMQNFRDSVELILASNAGIQIQSESELYHAIDELLSSPDKAMLMGQLGAIAVKNNSGATLQVLQYIEKYLMSN